jgi:hypothetical protein
MPRADIYGFGVDRQTPFTGSKVDVDVDVDVDTPRKRLGSTGDLSAALLNSGEGSLFGVAKRTTPWWRSGRCCIGCCCTVVLVVGIAAGVVLWQLIATGSSPATHLARRAQVSQG